MTDHPSVVQALASVMAELPNIGKGDRSPEGYQYRGIEAVTKHVQPLLAKHGVVISPKATITDVRPSPAMKDGWQDVFMSVEWTITGPDGSTIEAQTTGIGRDRSDKGANKAQTQAFKYLLLHLLCIADGKDDSDGVTYEHDRVEVVAWNAAMAKQHLVKLAEGDKAKAAQAWADMDGDGWGDYSPELTERAWEAWVNQPADETAPEKSAEQVIDEQTALADLEGGS